MQRPPAKRLFRISNKYQYRRIFKDGRLIKRSILWLYLLPSPDDKTRLGIIVSRAIDKRATARNRMKRIIRGWFSGHMGAAGGMWISAVIKRPVLPTVSASNIIRQELSSALK